LIICSSFIDKQFNNCGQYKVGKFYVYNKVSKQRVNIERKDSLQIEMNVETGDITVLNVNWVSDCEYELLFNYATPKEVSKSKRSQTVVEVSANIPLRIKILSGTDNYYLFEASKQGFKPLRDTVWLVKENASAFAN
jgi:hypothetical protein